MNNKYSVQKTIIIEQPICDGCGCEIDISVCHCGIHIKNHNPFEEAHLFVPIGCVCCYEHKDIPTDYAQSSGALKHQSDIYPKRYNGHVPWKIMMIKSVRSDFPLINNNPLVIAKEYEIYECWVNQNGAVSVIFPNNERLGVKPDEFKVVRWHSKRFKK